MPLKKSNAIWYFSFRFVVARLLPLPFFSGQSRFCGARFLVRRASGIKNALETGFKPASKAI